MTPALTKDQDQDDTSNGKAKSEELVCSLREKIAVYKELLLCELQERRLALVAHQAKSKHNAKSKSSAGTENTTSSSNDAACSTSHNKNNKTNQNDNLEDKSEDECANDKKPGKSKKRALEPTKRTLLANGLPTTQRRVLRTSMPSRKYFDGSLRSFTPTSPNHGVHSTTNTETDGNVANRGMNGTKDNGLLADRTSLTAVSSRASVEHVNEEFEKSLRKTVKLQREVALKTTHATRKRQLPRVHTPERCKNHWDILLQEMKWMASDFAAERNWKRVAQFHLARDIISAMNAEKVRQEMESRQLAREISLQVSAFWRTIERIAARSKIRFETAFKEQEEEQDISQPVKDSSSSTTSAESLNSSRDVKSTPKTSGQELEAGGGTNGSSNDCGDGSRISECEDDPLLKYRTIVVKSEASEDEEKIRFSKKKLRCIVEKAKLSRERMHTSTPTSDEAFAVLQSSSRSVLAAFQIVAIRWMVELCTCGLNVFLNDQLGMGKAATVAAFVRYLEIIEGVPRYPTPHLVLVAEEETHKWASYFRQWHPDRKIQIYEGDGGQRKKLQREWRERPSVPSSFLDGDESDSHQTVLCCICPISLFMKDRDAFVANASWQMIIVENEHEDVFDDPGCVATLKSLKCVKRRLLCNSQPLNNWKSGQKCHLWAEFLLDIESKMWSVEVWSRGLVVQKECMQEIMRSLGKASWKSCQETSALVLAYECLSLRRVRSEVETQLGKIDEHSVACSLTTSQNAQYRNAIAGFAASLNGNENRTTWFELFVRLRSICNCVDLLNDMDKLGHADLRIIHSCSGKLDTLGSLLPRLTVKENKRVLIYCQMDAMLTLLEMYLMLSELSFVRITGTSAMQQRALRHFALRDSVKIALASTRLSSSNGTRIMSVYGVDAIIVLDSDWNALCDAKLRASWARLAVTKEIQVFRFHCENTLEASLLRAGACLTEKAFGEMTPHELLASPESLKKPRWWSVTAVGTADAVQSLVGDIEDIEKKESYNGDFECPLIVHGELDAEEHLLLANTDELTPVEWYAVNFVHTTIDKRPEVVSTSAEGVVDSMDVTGVSHDVGQSFDALCNINTKNAWQQEEKGSLFYEPSSGVEAVRVFDETLMQNDLTVLLERMRINGLDPLYECLAPPDPSTTPTMYVADNECEATRTKYRVSYRVVIPAPQKLMGTSPQDLLKPIKLKKQRASQSKSAATEAQTTAGVKRKLEQAEPTAVKKNVPERVDFEGIPIPDVAEFEDDDFWGDTNLDALDSVSWDDASVLTGILGPSLDPNGLLSGASSSSGASNTPQRTNSKKMKASSGSVASGGARTARKSSLVDLKDGWSSQDDVALRKLYEIYGANWTLIAHVMNSTAVSRYFCKKRTARQCYDRYGKIISGTLSSSKDSTTKGLKHQKVIISPTKSGSPASVADTTLGLSPAEEASVVARIALPKTEALLFYPERDNLPGLPPAISNHLAKIPPSKGSSSSMDMRPIKGSFDAIIQCMKRKRAPPPIPIPGAGAGTTPPSTSSQLSSPASVTAAASTIVPPPHKSHNDLISLLPSGLLGPDEVIKRSKQAAAAAVQAVAAVATVGRDASPLSSSAESGNGTSGFGSNSTSGAFSASSNATTASPVSTASIGSSSLPVNASTTSVNPLVGGVAHDSARHSGKWGATATTTNDVSGMQQNGIRPGLAAGSLSMGTSAQATLGTSVPTTASGIGTGMVVGSRVGAPVISSTATTAQPVASVNVAGAAHTPSTTALLEVIDRMPEIKNKIQVILNRNDCSESQKVAMIARLLSNTNAINTSTLASAAAMHPAPTPVPVSGPAVMDVNNVPTTSVGGSAGLSVPLAARMNAVNTSLQVPLSVPASSSAAVVTTPATATTSGGLVSAGMSGVGARTTVGTSTTMSNANTTTNPSNAPVSASGPTKSSSDPNGTTTSTTSTTALTQN